jgi:hypothetical protein
LGDPLRDPLLNGRGRRSGHAYTCTRGRDPRWRRARIEGLHMDGGVAILQSPSGQTLLLTSIKVCPRPLPGYGAETWIGMKRPVTPAMRPRKKQR